MYTGKFCCSFFSLFTRCYERRLSSGSGRWSSCWASRVQVTASPSLALQADTATEHDVICSPFAQKRSVPSSCHAPPISPHQRRASSFGARKLTLRDDAFSQYIKILTQLKNSASCTETVHENRGQKTFTRTAILNTTRYFGCRVSILS